jgi:hypothetical protein
MQSNMVTTQVHFSPEFLDRCSEIAAAATARLGAKITRAEVLRASAESGLSAVANRFGVGR